MTGREKFHKRIVILFWASLIFCIGFTWYYAGRMVPDRLSIVENEEEIFHFPALFDTTIHSESEEVVLGNGSNIPANEIHITSGDSFSICGKNQGSYKLGMKLFGLIKFKDIQVDVVDERYAVPCGLPVGIYLKSKGVMVIGTGEVIKKGGEAAEPAAGILRSGDYIEAFNGQPLDNKEALIQQVNQNKEQDAVLTVRREGEEIDVKVNPVCTEEGDYKLGAWVRDDTQGIGTMTYVDLNGHFGALGHGISDSDTGNVVEIAKGNLYDTEILGINKGSVGNPGVMSGVIYYGPGSLLGDIESNTDEGIFGTVNQRFTKGLTGEAIEIGYRQDVHKGKAVIRSSVSGELKDYEIEIQKVDYSSTHKSKGMVIKVTDQSLIDLTGGIVQGMSGSPIIQDGKLVGAVTHVFIQDSTKGYGIFIENMLEH
ncbi:SpoIVB peptidase [Clostridium sp. AM58-1XD]|uniref:SpoIVB peptidase n=1 Tax=Clostridium sp. AM58-1XD TaxID=2292307 RepID=UPI000E4F1148|nr:SpoIVB peptidase [Clostridium sp. AM58-1XD]RGZ00928.1 SpoIVB peptidase [Clostridium sp. AM58-1XD]